MEVPGLRAAAAVWKYDSKTEELRMFWLMDDDSKHTARLGSNVSCYG